MRGHHQCDTHLLPLETQGLGLVSADIHSQMSPEHHYFLHQKEYLFCLEEWGILQELEDLMVEMGLKAE